MAELRTTSLVSTSTAASARFRLPQAAKEPPAGEELEKQRGQAGAGIVGEDLHAAEGEAGDEAREFRPHLHEPKRHPCPALRSQRGDRGTDHTLHTAEHNGQQYGERVKLRGCANKAC